MSMTQTIGGKILKAMTGGTAFSIADPYIGLLTDVDTQAEASYAEYARVKLTSTGINGLSLMGSTVTTVTDDDGNTWFTIDNQEIIYFPECEAAAGGTIVGVGIYESRSATAPVLWAALSEPVTLNQYSVPMFRIDKMMLKIK